MTKEEKLRYCSVSNGQYIGEHDTEYMSMVGIEHEWLDAQISDEDLIDMMRSYRKSFKPLIEEDIDGHILSGCEELYAFIRSRMGKCAEDEYIAKRIRKFYYIWDW